MTDKTMEELREKVLVGLNLFSMAITNDGLTPQILNIYTDRLMTDFRREKELSKAEGFAKGRKITEEEQRIQNSGRKLYQQGFKEGKAEGVREGELRGVAKILDKLWYNSYYEIGKLGADRIQKELEYYFGENWSTDMYDFVGEKGARLSDVKPLSRQKIEELTEIIAQAKAESFRGNEENNCRRSIK